MKYLIILFVLTSCSVIKPKEGCPALNQRNIDKHNNRKFRVEKIWTNKKGEFMVKVRKAHAMQPTYVKLGPFECLPDSLNTPVKEIIL